jgi:hypothetical protein
MAIGQIVDLAGLQIGVGKMLDAHAKTRFLSSRTMLAPFSASIMVGRWYCRNVWR